MRLFVNMLKIFGWRPKAKRDFPTWCEARCHGALNEAKRLIESTGIKLKAHDITVGVRADTQRREGGWGWFCPTLDIWVGELTAPDGKLVEIAIDPAHLGNPNALHSGSLVHGMGHHWLITNGYGGGHDPMFDGLLPGWREARKVLGR